MISFVKIHGNNHLHSIVVKTLGAKPAVVSMISEVISSQLPHTYQSSQASLHSYCHGTTCRTLHPKVATHQSQHLHEHTHHRDTSHVSGSTARGRDRKSSVHSPKLCMAGTWKRRKTDKNDEKRRTPPFFVYRRTHPIKLLSNFFIR